ncbi:MAG: hypothetical protein QM727_08765 [Niabella sp.]
MRYLFAFVCCFCLLQVTAQNRLGGMNNRLKSMNLNGGGNDSLAKRDKFADSITISYRYMDTTRSYKLDSSISDFSLRYAIPSTYYFLGNTGNAAQSYLFSPMMKSGWDAGFHAFDAYKFTVEDARFYTTTRPYSEINYSFGQSCRTIYRPDAHQEHQAQLECVFSLSHD